MTSPANSMISVEEARERILSFFSRLPPVSVPALDALGQVLAADVFAPFDIPPLDNTAMDGYAVRSADTTGASETAPRELRVVADLAAGYVLDTPVGPGEAVRIMTGAPMPPGADAVVPFEETDEPLRATGEPPRKGDTVKVLKGAEADANIRFRGEDVHSGDAVLHAGRVVRASEVGVLASLGITEVQVYRRPVVAILSTGDEVTEPGQPLLPGRIYDANAYGIAAMVKRCGGIPRLLGIAHDTIDDLTAKLREGYDADMIVTSAGVSRGDFDVVKDVLAREGAIDFWTVRMKPGKPLAFGAFQTPSGRKVPHLGLPGNPVSSFVSFELLARPALRRLAGHADPERVPVLAIADADMARRSDGKTHGVRVYGGFGPDGRLHVRSTGPQGSHQLAATAAAQGLAEVVDGDGVPAGGEVPVLWFD